jgi:hypothetical protein
MVNRSQIKKTLLTISISLNVLLCFSQTVWTKEYEENIYSQVYKTMSLNFPNDSLRQQFSTCIIEKLKKALPGGLQSLPTDSLNKLVNGIGGACRTELNSTYLTKWTPEFEKAFKQSLHESLKKILTRKRESRNVQLHD